MYFWGIRNRDKQARRHMERCILVQVSGKYWVISSDGRVEIQRNRANSRVHCTYIMRIRSQSGHIQVGPLLMPHLFSSKQSLQIMNPQGQLQQNSCFCLQQ